MKTPTVPQNALCSNCKLEAPAPGQRWCANCKKASAAKGKATLEPITVLQPDGNNANAGTARGQKMVGESVRDHGFGRSIVVDENFRVIAGNKTLKAAIASGAKSIRVIDSDGAELIVHRRTDLNLETDQAAQRLAIADNRTSEIGLEWDPFAMMKAADGGMDLSAYFTPKELGAITAAARGQSSATDEVPDLPATPVTKPGDLYQLGRHRLLCGDSTQPAHIDLALGGLKAHMAWTDPPYNVDYVGKTADALTIQNDLKSSIAFAAFLDEAMAALSHGLYDGAAVYVAHSDSWGHLFRGSFLRSGLLLKQCLIWAKDAFVMGRQDHHWQHEPILYGFKEAVRLDADITEDPGWEHLPILYGWKPGAAHSWYSNRRQSTILSFARPKRSAVHPTMKPVALVEYNIRNSSKEGDRVLDGFGGSGTTLMACEASGRDAVLLELDAAYCDVIVQRFEEHTGIKAIKNAYFRDETHNSDPA